MCNWPILCSPCPLHEQPKMCEFTFLGPIYAIQLHVCLTPLVLEESILLVIFVRKLSLTVNIYVVLWPF